MKTIKPTASNSNIITAPDFSSLLDGDISTTGDWINQKSGGAASVVSTTTGSAKKDGKKVEREWEEWCAVCHDGGTLYCCDKCPKVYHLSCYIPPISPEPPGDWVCLMCSSVGDIKAVMSPHMSAYQC